MSPCNRVALFCAVLAVSGCAGTKTASIRRVASDRPARSSSKPDGPVADSVAKNDTPPSQRGADEERARLRDELSALEEENRILELELRIAFEELLKADAPAAHAQSRAYTVSRISEVRVEIGSFRAIADPEVRTRLARADELLIRADAALSEDDLRGATFLAERAGALIERARALTQALDDRP